MTVQEWIEKQDREVEKLLKGDITEEAKVAYGKAYTKRNQSRVSFVYKWVGEDNKLDSRAGEVYYDLTKGWVASINLGGFYGGFHKINKFLKCKVVSNDE